MPTLKNVALTRELNQIMENKMKFLRSDGMVILTLAIIAVMSYFLVGCSGTIDNLRDGDFTVGCKVTEAEAKLGYFNQEGTGVVCKLKCSEDLPANFTYEYENSRTGCKVSVGTTQ